MQSGSPSSPGGGNHPIDLEHWVMRTRPQYLSVSGTQVDIPAASASNGHRLCLNPSIREMLKKDEHEDCQVQGTFL